jgi:glycosyltransferase involved in cell wall biosynthesis
VNLDIVSNEIKRNAFAACDVLVLPSKSEAFGMVYLEAWICEKPVIGCNIESTSQVITHMKDGLLVTFGDKTQLANSIIYLLNNPELCKKFGKVGKEKTRLFDSEKVLEDFEKICVDIVSNFNNSLQK